MSPNTDTIQLFLTAITSPWIDHTKSAQLEIRCIAEGSQIKFRRFYLENLQQASHYAETMNADNFNIYACVNPVSSSTLLESKAAKDVDILQAHFAFADCDTPGSAETLENNAPQYDFYVITGTKPHLRCHFYWQFNQPVLDLQDWKETQKTIAKIYGADEKVCNPSRIMRVAGTIAYPSAKKQRSGYVTELTRMTGLQSCQ